MMYGIDPDVQIFLEEQEGRRNGTLQNVDDVTKTRDRDLLPTAKIQAHLFDPCGYLDEWMLFESFGTIHVTPEEHSH